MPLKRKFKAIVTNEANMDTAQAAMQVRCLWNYHISYTLLLLVLQNNLVLYAL